MKHFSNKLASIRLLALDVDGVLTDGGIIYTADNVEIKQFNVKDGYGIVSLIKKGIPVAIITARTSQVVEARAKELGITHVYQGAKNKLETLQTLIEKLEIPIEAVAYMGDDIPDLAVLQAVGLACCPADAVDTIKAACDWVTQSSGGRGAVREVCDAIMREV